VWKKLLKTDYPAADSGRTDLTYAFGLPLLVPIEMLEREIYQAEHGKHKLYR
jgi:hypothetical protein